MALPLLNTGLIWAVGTHWDPHRLTVPLLCGLLALELVALHEWLRRRGALSRAWRLLLAGITIAANTGVFVFISIYVVLFIVCSSGACD
jgi:hypothetical protein